MPFGQLNLRRLSYALIVIIKKPMLDKSLIGEPEPKEYLKCEECGLKYNDDDNWNSIDETGLCCDCHK